MTLGCNFDYVTEHINGDISLRAPVKKPSINISVVAITLGK